MKYHPITDTFKLLSKQAVLINSDEFEPVYPTLAAYIKDIEQAGVCAKTDLMLLLGFLNNVVGSSVGTQNRFRNESERFILFLWNEKRKSIVNVDVEDIRDYIDWIWSPPKTLIADTTIASRFKSKAKTDVRLVNSNWRPFVMRQSKANRKTDELISPDKAKRERPKKAYSINQTSLQNAYASLNVFLKELNESGHIKRNPLPLVKRSCKYLIKGKVYKPPHTIDDDTWELFVETLTSAADENPYYERHRFLVLALKVLFLRISELSHKDYFVPVFGHFRQDSSGEGWVLSVIGKGAFPKQNLKYTHSE